VEPNINEPPPPSQLLETLVSGIGWIIETGALEARSRDGGGGSFIFGSTPHCLLQPSRLTSKKKNPLVSACGGARLLFPFSLRLCEIVLESDQNREFELAPTLLGSRNSYSVIPNSSLQFIATCEYKHLCD
jgi:hypothetical protein